MQRFPKKLAPTGLQC